MAEEQVPYTQETLGLNLSSHKSGKTSIISGGATLQALPPFFPRN